MGFEDDLRRVEEHVAEARRIVQGQKGLIVRLRAAGVGTLDAQRILWLLESNLRRLEEHSSEESEGVKGVVLLTRYGGDSIKRFRGPPELAQGIAQC
jgi:hypothetical protein